MPRGVSGNPAKRSWKPMTRGTMNPSLLEALVASGVPPTDLPQEAWSNDRYQAVVRRFPSDIVHLSIKRHDRAPIRDWRHMQQIKNEIVGPEREGCELFPAESRLADQANEFHLWVIPEGERFPFGFADRSVMQPEELDEHLPAGHKAKQRSWEPGLTTGQPLEALDSES